MRLRLLVSLGAWAAVAVWFFVTQNSGARHGGPISVPKMLWLAYAILAWFVVPVFLFADRRIDAAVRRVFRVFWIVMAARGVAEALLLYVFKHWTPLYGIAHDVACILILVFLRRGVTVRDPASRRALRYSTSLIVALVAEISFAAMFLQTKMHREDVYFASNEAYWNHINLVTSVVLAFVYPDLAALLTGLWLPGRRKLWRGHSAAAVATALAALAGLGIWTARLSPGITVTPPPPMSQGLFFAIGGGVVLALILLELRVPSFRNGMWGEPRKVWRNWPYLFAMSSTIAIASTVTHRFPAIVPALWPLNLPFGFELAACFLVGELANYGLHWVQHNQRYLWRFHFQHHREENYDLWLAAHFHSVEIFVSSCVMSATFALFAFSPPAKQVYFLFYIFVTTYHHSSRAYTLGALDWIVVSPAFHRLHHTVDIRGNYSSTLTLWDVVFGTAVWPHTVKRALRYGIEPHGEPFGFVREFLHVLPRKRAKPRPAGAATPEAGSRMPEEVLR